MTNSKQRKGRTRGHGEGSVYKREDGKWVGQLTTYHPVTGKRHRPKRVRATRKEAAAALAQLKSEHLAGMSITDRPTTAEWHYRWIETQVRGRLAPATIESYEAHVRLHIAPAIGHVRLADLKPSHVAQLHRAVADKGLSPSTVQGVHRVLRAALTSAEREGLVVRNVARLQPPPATRRTKIVPPTIEQVRLVISEAPEEDRALYVLLFTAGLRIGEALALRWDDLALDGAAPTVAVTRRVQRKGGALRVGPTKTEGSEGRVPLGKAAVEALRRHRRLQRKTRVAMEFDWGDPDLVFPTTIGTQAEPRRAQARWARLREQLDLQHVRLHDFRHASATSLLEKGIPMKTVQELLRHSRMQTTADIYSHVTENLMHEAAGAFDELLGANPEEPMAPRTAT